MIVSRAKNQRAARDIIERYQHEHPDELHRNLELERFLKYFAKEIVPRVQEDDCYFIDLLEDLERLNNE